MYKRGTDLKHCPDECENLEVFDKFQPMSDLIQCFAFSTDTCPREQAEKPADSGSWLIPADIFMGMYGNKSEERTNE